MKVIGEIANGANGIATDSEEEEHFLVTDMRNLCDELAEYRNYQEAWNRASRVMDGVLEGFKLGVVRLEELAKVETLYWKLLRAVSDGMKSADFVPEDLKDIDDLLASQYLCNFSLFQSAADSWAIGQVLPVVPLRRLNETPTNHCTLADITCDMHNLFGRLNEVHVFCDDEDPTDFYIEEVIPGSSAAQVLTIMQYNAPAMADQVKRMIDAEIRKGAIRSREGVRLTDFFESCLYGYTYLK